MSDWMERYASMDAKDLLAPKLEPVEPQLVKPQQPHLHLAQFNSGGGVGEGPVSRTQGLGGRRDRESRPLNDVLGDAHNVSYYDNTALDAKVAACTKPTLRILDLPKNVNISFWKDDKGYFFFFPNGQDGKKPHYLPPMVTRVEVVQNGQRFGQDLAQIKQSVDQAIAKLPPPQPPVRPGEQPPAGPAIAGGGKPPAVAGGDQHPGGNPGRGLGGYNPGGDLTVQKDQPLYALNRNVQRGTAIASEVYFARLAAQKLGTGGPITPQMMMRTNIGSAAGGEIGKYLIDQQFFPNANPSFRTYLIDGASPAVLLTRGPWYVKLGTIVGAHTVARLWDASDKKK